MEPWEPGRRAARGARRRARGRTEARGGGRRRGGCQARWGLGGPRGEQRDEHVGGIEAALIGGAEDAGEDLLTGGAALGAIPAAPHFAGDHRGPQGVLSAPVGGVERGLEE